MKTRVHGVSILLTVTLLALAGSTIGAPKPKRGAERSPVDTASISAQVKHKLAMLPWYGVFDDLGYQVKGSEVILTGQVVGQHAQTKHDAEKEVKSISGVTQVVNNIEVLPTSPFDDQIRRAEYRAIFSRPDLSGYSMGTIPQIHIIVKGGHVTLEGTVMNQMDRNVAEVSAKSVPGVFSVTNNLRVAG